MLIEGVKDTVKAKSNIEGNQNNQRPREVLYFSVDLAKTTPPVRLVLHT